jgi:hypothetical protein
MTSEDIFEKPIEEVNLEIEKRIKEELKLNPPKIISNEFIELRQTLMNERDSIVQQTLVVANKLYEILKSGLSLTNDSIIEPMTRTFKPRIVENCNSCQFKIEFVIGDVYHHNFHDHSCFAINVVYHLGINGFQIEDEKKILPLEDIEQHTELVCDIVKRMLCAQIKNSFQEFPGLNLINA